MFQQQDSFNSRKSQWDYQTMQNKAAQLAQQATGGNLTAILNGMNSYPINRSLRNSFDYACSLRIPRTPSYLINGVWVPDASNITTVDGWKKLFKSIS